MNVDEAQKIVRIVVSVSLWSLLMSMEEIRECMDVGFTNSSTSLLAHRNNIANISELDFEIAF